jgi:hypothetical protein
MTSQPQQRTTPLRSVANLSMSVSMEGSSSVSKSILEAIQQGLWDYEPAEAHANEFRATGAMPGTDQKLSILAERVRRGLPLWHPSDRKDFDQMHEDYSN